MNVQIGCGYDIAKLQSELRAVTAERDQYRAALDALASARQAQARADALISAIYGWPRTPASS